MFHWRITKYNPQNRNSEGVYLKNEWTSYSDIGKNFENGKLTIQDYLKQEDAYIDAIIYFMECLNLNSLKIINLEKNKQLKRNKYYPAYMIHAYDTFKEGQLITKELIEIIVRLALRENLWCKLEDENMYVHFGWDYYMYIGSKKPCIESIKKIEQSGLFVETYESPYINKE